MEAKAEEVTDKATFQIDTCGLREMRFCGAKLTRSPELIPSHRDLIEMSNLELKKHRLNSLSWKVEKGSVCCVTFEFTADITAPPAGSYQDSAV